MLVGHAHPEATAAAQERIAQGTTFFANNRWGIELAEAIVAAVPCADQVRFVSTGSETDLYAIKLVFSIPPDRPTPNFPPSWNAAPTDLLPVVRCDRRAGERSFGLDAREPCAVLGQGRRSRSRAGCLVLFGLLKPAFIPYSV